MPMLTLASPSVASVGANAEMIRRSAVPRSVEIEFLLVGRRDARGAGQRQRASARVEGHVLHRHQAACDLEHRRADLRDLDAGQREVGLVERQRAGDALERGTRDARIERRRHAPVDAGERRGAQPRRERRLAEPDDAELGEAGLCRPAAAGWRSLAPRARRAESRRCPRCRRPAIGRSAA